ncbi:MAG TPA: hypothetical protein VMZ26_09645 [Pyrinomonadaceae bacterium]|nr:hypothetical protein [Pyrinomonadaceae bacterium]
MKTEEVHPDDHRNEVHLNFDDREAVHLDLDDREAVHLDFEELQKEFVEPVNETSVTVESEPLGNERRGFWERQFSQEPTRKQRMFDWAYGVIIPLICVAADPGVFRNLSGASGLLGEARPFAYLLSAVSILGMAAWLLWGRRLKSLAAPLAGLFFFGSAVSAGVGVILSPFSFFGLFFVIGALGFTPLFSSVVFLRNGVRAYRSASANLADQAALQAVLLGALFSFVIPYVATVEITKLVDEVVAGDVDTIQRQSLKLRILAPLVDPGPIARSYFDSPEEEDSPRMRKLADLYEQLSGADIKQRRGSLNFD